MFFLLYRHTDEGGIFDYFPKISDHFPKISEKSPKLDNVRRSHECCKRFLKNSKDYQRFPKIAEDFQGRPENVSMIHQRNKEKFETQT